MWMLGQKSHCDCIDLFILLSEGGRPEKTGLGIKRSPVIPKLAPLNVRLDPVLKRRI